MRKRPPPRLLHKFIVLGLLIALSFALVSPSHADETFYNPEFESSLSGWTTNAHWSWLSTFNGTDGVARGYGNGVDWSESSIEQSVYLISGTYTIEWRAAINAYGSSYNSSKAVVDGVYSSMNVPTTSWQTFSHEFSVADGYHTIGIRSSIGYDGTAGGRVYIDWVHLDTNESAPPSMPTPTPSSTAIPPNSTPLPHATPYCAATPYTPTGDNYYYMAENFVSGFGNWIGGDGVQWSEYGYPGVGSVILPLSIGNLPVSKTLYVIKDDGFSVPIRVAGWAEADERPEGSIPYMQIWYYRGGVWFPTQIFNINTVWDQFDTVINPSEGTGPVTRLALMAYAQRNGALLDTGGLRVDEIQVEAGSFTLPTCATPTPTFVRPFPTLIPIGGPVDMNPGPTGIGPRSNFFGYILDGLGSVSDVILGALPEYHDIGLADIAQAWGVTAPLFLFLYISQFVNFTIPALVLVAVVALEIVRAAMAAWMWIKNSIPFAG